MKRLKLLIQLVYDPKSAIAQIFTRAPYLTAIGLSILSSIIYFSRSTGLSSDLKDLIHELTQVEGLGRFILFAVLPGLLQKTLLPLLYIAAFIVPLCIVLSAFFKRQGGYTKLIRTQYLGMLSVVLYAWSLSHFLLLLPALLVFSPRSINYDAALLLGPLPYFCFLFALALRALFRLRPVQTATAVVLSIMGFPLLLAGSYYVLTTIPILLVFWMIMLMRGYFSEMWAAQRARVRFEESLALATLNPADASAHYNLGRIYQQRGQIDDAIGSYRRAIEIDADELDAHYQLGRIAREQRSFGEAISHYDAIVRRDMEYSQHEIWREVGATYYGAGQYEDALNAFSRFLMRRSTDAEGMFFYGLTLYQIGQREASIDQMRAVIETVQKAPAYKYRTERRWMIEAQSFLRSQNA